MGKKNTNEGADCGYRFNEDKPAGKAPGSVYGGADCGWEGRLTPKKVDEILEELGEGPMSPGRVYAGEEPTVGLSPASIQQLSKLALGGYTSTFENDLDKALGKIKELLLAKNKAYGDAALNPLRFHSSASPVEQLNVRMDDKLSRMARGGKSGEDEPLDYVGYWVLREIALMREERKKF